MPYHIKVDRVPERVLLTGDPLRADRFGKLFDAKLVSSSREFRVYVGLVDSVPFAIVSHGIGGPSAAIVVEELISVGARYLVRVGTAGALEESARAGDIIIATALSSVHRGGGLGLYFGDLCPPSSPDPVLTTRLIETAKLRGLKVSEGPVFSSDSFYAEANLTGLLRGLRFKAIEMECATITALANLRGAKAACMLVVSNSAGSTNTDEDVVQRSLDAAADVALRTLARFSS